MAHDYNAVSGAPNGNSDVAGFWSRYDSVKYYEVAKNTLIEVRSSISSSAQSRGNPS